MSNEDEATSSKIFLQNEMLVRLRVILFERGLNKINVYDSRNNVESLFDVGNQRRIGIRKATRKMSSYRYNFPLSCPLCHAAFPPLHPLSLITVKIPYNEEVYRFKIILTDSSMSYRNKNSKIFPN